MMNQRDPDKSQINSKIKQTKKFVTEISTLLMKNFPSIQVSALCKFSILVLSFSFLFYIILLFIKFTYSTKQIFLIS